MKKILIIYLIILPIIGLLATIQWENNLIPKTLWLAATIYAITLAIKGE